MSEVIMDETLKFSEDISYGSTGGPSYSTDVVTVNSGTETRNVNWTEARHTYDIAFGIRDQTYLNTLVEFFHACKGKAYGFRYKDWSDYTSSGLDLISDTDQDLGIGDDTTTIFQLTKKYISGFITTRTIQKPIVDTVIVSLDGINTTAWSIDTTTGIITFNTAPVLNTVIKVGYKFDVPCRFDTDQLSINLEMYEHGTASVPLVELRL